jgi:hypothetical protein
MNVETCWRSGEWRLVFPKAVQHLTLGLAPWLHEPVVRVWSALSSAGFQTIGPVGDPAPSAGIEPVPVEDAAEGRVAEAKNYYRFVQRPFLIA